MHPQTGDTIRRGNSVTYSSPAAAPVTIVFGNENGAVSTEQILGRAEQILAKLAPDHGPITLTGGGSGGVNGVEQTIWCLTCSAAPSDESSGEVVGTPTPTCPDIELRYDADTGCLIYAEASSLSSPPDETGGDRTLLTASEAITAARNWLTKLGLSEGGTPAPLLCPPRRNKQDFWMVWFQGRESPQGPPLTVRVSVDAVTGALQNAAIAERAAYPRLYLPPRPDMPKR
jgi:hypothetical protein